MSGQPTERLPHLPHAQRGDARVIEACSGYAEAMARAVELLGRPASVRKARVFTGDVLADDGVEASVIELAVLLVSELVTNAVVRARGTICLTVHTDAHWVRIEVEDQGRSPPVLRPATQDQPKGRGLMVVDKLATDWGTQRRANHKVVWFEIAR
jgi:anti-sigma regulatory factor (Ser/Thr protein kinase)